jgi:DNA-binding IscR family transcriptional regulator
LTHVVLCNIERYMKRDSRLSGILHVLLHMAEEPGPITSEMLAAAMHTNPVVVRRIMAGLRNAGFVRSERGHGGGWTIARKLHELTLRDIYVALGSPELFAMGNRTEAPGCLVEQAVNAALDASFHEAEALLLERFGRVTLAALSTDFHARLAERGGTLSLEQAHAV